MGRVITQSVRTAVIINLGTHGVFWGTGNLKIELFLVFLRAVNFTVIQCCGKFTLRQKQQEVERWPGPANLHREASDQPILSSDWWLLQVFLTSAWDRKTSLQLCHVGTEV